MDRFLEIAHAMITGGAVFYIIYGALNLISFILYVADKCLSKTRLRRISEKTLIGAAAIAPFGALIGMGLVRHKTRHLKFVLCVPFFSLVHIALFTVILFL